MNVKIESYMYYAYDDIQKEYGSVLHEYGLTKSDDGYAYINVNSVEDLFEINKKLRKLDDEREEWSVYFGILVECDDYGVPILTIKDNYD